MACAARCVDRQTFVIITSGMCPAIVVINVVIVVTTVTHDVIVDCKAVGMPCVIFYRWSARALSAIFWGAT